MGDWLRKYGESVYGTQAGSLGKQPWGRITRRRTGPNATRLYLHLWDFTPGTALLIPGLTHEPVQAMVLETGQRVKAEAGQPGLWVELPKALVGLTLPVIAVDVKEPI